MAGKKMHHSYLVALPGRAWVARTSLGLLVTVGLCLLVMSKTGNPAAIRLRTQLTDALAPVLTVAARPLDALYDAGSWLNGIMQMQAENTALREQNVQLLQWQQAAKNMAAENQALKTLLHVVPDQSHAYTTVRVVSDLGGPYLHSALVNGGRDAGIKKDQPVINGNGLVGRIVDAGNGSARVLLLGDINSRVPVMVERTRERSILVGNNNELPTLAYQYDDSKVAIGDRIVTSGDGGMFPAGIPVGTVTSIEKGAVTVQPFVDAETIEYVSVLDYSL